MSHSKLTDNAIRLWLAHFMNPGNTLCFGGDGAKMEITDECRDALNELVEAGAAQTIPPVDSWPGREYYGGTSVDLRDELRSREHLNPFTDEYRFVTFTKKKP